MPTRLFLSFALVLLFPLSGLAQSAGGLTWKVPQGWKEDGARPMRAATYKVPPAQGAADEAELAVFYFGKGGGGGVDANVQRWVSQFDQPDQKPSSDKVKTKKETQNGMPVTTVDLTGIYTASMGPMAPKSNKPNFRLLGAIVEGPEGAVFFKLTGPAKTVAAAEKDFRKLLSTVKP